MLRRCVAAEESRMRATGHFRPGAPAGGMSWTRVAEGVPHRTAKQCRIRYLSNLDPALNRAKWTEEEITLIYAQRRLRGNRWADIARMLPGRTDNQVSLIGQRGSAVP